MYGSDNSIAEGSGGTVGDRATDVSSNVVLPSDFRILLRCARVGVSRSDCFSHLDIPSEHGKKQRMGEDRLQQGIGMSIIGDVDYPCGLSDLSLIIRG